MTDLSTVHHHIEHNDAGNERKRRVAGAVRLLRLSSSGALAAIAIVGFIGGFVTRHLEQTLSIPSWLEWAAGGIGFSVVLLAAAIIHSRAP